MKKNLSLVVLFIAICLSCVLFVYIDTRNVVFCPGKNGQLAIKIRLNAYEETVNPYYCERENTYYYFLPSALCGNEIYNGFFNKEILIEHQKLGRYGKFQWEDNKIYTINYGDSEIEARFLRSSRLPVLFITTKDGSFEQLNADKTDTEQGRIDVIEANGSVSYSGGLSIRGRGNSTYRMFEKKPFNIKLNKAAGILGMKKDKDWCLLANSWDYSYMNNKLAFDMASKAGFRYAPESEYADVYFNGDYWGVYLVAEKIEIDENRIDITNLKKKNEEANPGLDYSSIETFDTGKQRGVYLNHLPEDITGGYLIERDYRLRTDYYGIRAITTSYFETDGLGTAYNIKFPQYADQKEVEYISNLTNEMEQAITSLDGYSSTGKYYLDYIDLDSWVKCYMIAEIAYDLDKDVTNTYYYKDTDRIDSRFYSGPVWDYDCRFGGTESYSPPEILTKLSSGEEDPILSGGYSQLLYNKAEFFDAVCEKWNGFFREYLTTDAQRNIDYWQNLISESVKMDNIRWFRGDGYPVPWPSDGEEFTNEYSFDYEVDHLRKWIKTRCDFLDGYWGDK